MRRCFDLARLAAGKTSPNPMVGSVLVYEDRIIGEGFHRQYGGPHAEVIAVGSVADRDRPYIEKSTIYVSLEPCFHYGKTPPCVELILKHKIPEVVISSLDPFPKVNGKSVELLRSKGVKVVTGFLGEEGNWLARAFFTQVQKKRPYIILKYAQTQNGFMGEAGKQVWISNHWTKRFAHKWRHQADAILVGTKTAMTDNPSLTTRHWYGDSPLRIAFDRTNKIPPTHHLFDKQAPTLLITEQQSDHFSKAEKWTIPFDENLLPKLLHRLLTDKKIQTLLVEGGAETLHRFIRAGFWDEAHVITGNAVFENGIKAPVLSGQLKDQFPMGTDRIQLRVNPQPASL